jgi:hypothetical protein
VAARHGSQEPWHRQGRRLPPRRTCPDLQTWHHVMLGPYTPLPAVTEDGCAEIQHHSSKCRDRSWREAYPRRTDPETKRTLRIMICIMLAALQHHAAGARRGHVRGELRESVGIPYTINSTSQSALLSGFTQNQVTKICKVQKHSSEDIIFGFQSQLPILPRPARSQH